MLIPPILFFISLFLISCSTNLKEKSNWSDDDKHAFIEACKKGISSRIVGDSVKINKEVYCDCMFSKVSKKYTPDQLGSFTMTESLKIVKDCIESQE